MISLVDRAIGFAALAHDGQRRKSGKVPYIAHPVGVAMILQQMGCDETIVTAGRTLGRFRNITHANADGGAGGTARR